MRKFHSLRFRHIECLLCVHYSDRYALAAFFTVALTILFDVSSSSISIIVVMRYSDR